MSRPALAAAGIFAVLALAIWQIPGMKFTAWLCAGAAGVCLLWAVLCRWAQTSRRGKVCKAVFLACLCAGAVGFAAIEAVLIFQGEQDHLDDPADAVIVLGAGVNGTVPSLALSTRIDAAEEYLSRHPQTPAVLSGGQGPGEEITEARAMYDALTARGIDGGRLMLEERSTSTAENFAYSAALLREEGFDTENGTFAVVTNDFHCVRAQLLARRTGLNAFCVPAELPLAGLGANYYVREAFAMVKTVLFD